MTRLRRLATRCADGRTYFSTADVPCGEADGSPSAVASGGYACCSWTGLMGCRGVPSGISLVLRPYDVLPDLDL